MRKPLTMTHVLNSMCPRAGESIILRTMCPHSNIEMMLSPKRAICNSQRSPLFETVFSFARGHLFWNTCSRGGENIIREEGSSIRAGAHGGHATPQLKADLKAKAIGETNENQRHPSVKTTGKWKRIWDAAWDNFDCKSYLQNHRENQSGTSVKTTGIAKTIEKTKKNKKTKISEPMGSQNHWENQKEIKKTKISGPMTVNPNHLSWNRVCLCFLFSRCFWLPIGSGILVCLFLLAFSMVVGYPLILSG